MATPNISDPFWRFDRSWTIARLDGGSNTNNANFTTLLNPTNSAGYFSTIVSNGDIVLNFTSYSTNDLFWSADGSELGGAGTWNTASARWGNSSSGPFGQVWNNGSGKGAIFESTGGWITIGVPVTVSKLTIGVSDYGFTGTKAITFTGAAEVDCRETRVGDTNKIDFACPINAAVLTKVGPGRMHMTATNEYENCKWIVKEGLLSANAVNRLGSLTTLVADHITLDGGGIGVPVERSLSGSLCGHR
jgi:hypothetical protein